MKRHVFCAASLLAGCNAIFGIDEARLRDDDGGSSDGGPDVLVDSPGFDAKNDGNVESDAADAGGDALGDADANVDASATCTVTTPVVIQTTNPDHDLSLAYQNGSPLVTWRMPSAIQSAPYVIAYGTVIDGGPNVGSITPAPGVTVTVARATSNASAALLAYGSSANGGQVEPLEPKTGTTYPPIPVPVTAGAPSVSAVASAQSKNAIVTGADAEEGWIESRGSKISLSTGSTVVVTQDGTTVRFSFVEVASGEITVHSIPVATPTAADAPVSYLITSPGTPSIDAVGHAVSAAASNGKLAVLTYTKDNANDETLSMNIVDLANGQVTTHPVSSGLRVRRYGSVVTGNGGFTVAWLEGASNTLTLQRFTLAGVAMGPMVTVLANADPSRFGFASAGPTANEYAIATVDGSTPANIEIRRVTCPN